MITQYRHEKGQGLVEYALILLLVSIVVIVVLMTFGTEVVGEYQKVLDEFSAF